MASPATAVRGLPRHLGLQHRQGGSRALYEARMAILLRTSRTQVDRLLDAENDITLSSLQRAAAIVGRRVNIELV
jgi:hypothetical protein